MKPSLELKTSPVRTVLTIIAKMFLYGFAVLRKTRGGQQEDNEATRRRQEEEKIHGQAAHQKDKKRTTGRERSDTAATGFFSPERTRTLTVTGLGNGAAQTNPPASWDGGDELGRVGSVPT